MLVVAVVAAIVFAVERLALAERAAAEQEQQIQPPAALEPLILAVAVAAGG
jgi:hypothetical protein